jgi:predicted AlkP superfamily phosphohydrolase/phosphomutase
MIVGNRSDQSQTLIASLKLTLTFWLLAGVFVWLNILLHNRLYSINGDIVKIFIAAVLWYGAVGVILWIPVWIGGKILKIIRLFGGNEYRLQLACHWLAAVMLTFFYQMHRVWFPYTWAFSFKGILESVVLFLAGVLSAWLIVMIAARLAKAAIFKGYLRTLVSGVVFLVAVYIGVLAFNTVKNRFHAEVPEELNRAYDTGTKVLLIGFDGATWDEINPLIEQGKMPNFKAFLDEGIGAPLETTRPTLSAILWTSVVTGKSSKGHGVTEIVSTITPGLENNVLNYPYVLGCNLFAQLLLKEGYFYVTPLSSSARRTKALWNILTDYKKRVGVVGWWGTFPPEEVDGVVISDHASMAKVEMREAKGQLSSGDNLPESLTEPPVYPPELMKELVPISEQTQAMTLEELNYFLPADSAKLAYINSLSNWDRRHRESVIKIAYLTDKFFRLATEHLLDTQKFDLLCSYFFETDGIAHWMWPYKAADYFPELPRDQVEKYRSVIDSTYVNMDRILGSILKHIPEDTHVIIISDHGFGVEDYGSFYSVGHTMAPDGILMMKGPEFKTSTRISPKAHLEDITPTILALLGIPVGEDMEGRVLKEVFEDDFLQQYPLRTIPSHDRGKVFHAKATLSNEDDLLKDKLRALGYIE